MAKWLALSLIGLAVCPLALGCGGDRVESPRAAGEAAANDGGEGVQPVAFNLAGAPVVTFRVPAMHCEACEAGVRKALMAEVGVLDVQAFAEEKVVRVAVDEATFDAAAAADAIEAAEYGEAKLIEKAEDPAAPPSAESAEQPALDTADDAPSAE